MKDKAKQAYNWLMEREGKTSEDPPSPNEEVDQTEPSTDQEPATAAAPSVTYVVDHPKQVGDNALVLWHDRNKKKMVAKMDDDFIDLDYNLSSKHHGALSILLID
ncbi:MAG: hypothetical protein P8046_13265, partial [Anaerolineales bacterium]